MKYPKLDDMFLKTQHFFLDYTNFTDGSEGYGLTSDHSKLPERASIAATGFMFCALILAVESHKLTKDSAKEIVFKTLKTLKRLDHYKGFYPHFLNRSTGDRWGLCEYSTIDTMLMMMGLIAIDAYFNDVNIKKDIDFLIDRIDWSSFITIYQGKKVFAMAYNPDKEGDYVQGQPGYIYHWHMYAEQLMMYLLYDGDDAKELYDNLERPIGQFNHYTYVHSPANTLFIYHFPLAFIDTKNYEDANGFSIYENAKIATQAHQALSQSLSPIYKTFHTYAFGFNASDTPKGYRVFHAIPNHTNTVKTDGTVSALSIVGAYPFMPKIIQPSLEYLSKIPGFNGTYGFMDAFNQENDLWVSDKIIAIDKGLEMLSIDAVLFQTIHKLVTNHARIQQGMKRLSWKKRG